MSTAIAATASDWMLIAAGAGFAVVGMVLLRAAQPRAKWRPAHPSPRSARRPRQRLAGRAGALTFTSIACGVITGGQWAVLSQTGPSLVWAVVLWLPAFLAGATVARLLVALRTIHGRRRSARPARHEQRDGR